MRTFRFLLALTFTTLNGCKVILEVPEGGTVTTNSGEYVCGEAETCEVDVDTAGFDETFTAVPNEGWEFRGWTVRDSGLCQREEERLDSCRVSTVGFDVIPGLVALLTQDIPFYLEPDFGIAPTTTITFPWDGSNAPQSAVSVRGIARDGDGVRQVMINGVLAVVSPLENSGVSETQYFTEVEWTATVRLEVGQNTLVPVVTDGLENTNTNAEPVTVNYFDVPIDFDIDPDNNRLIGRGDRGLLGWRLVSYDLASKTETLITDRLRSGFFGCFKPDTSEYVYPNSIGNFQYEIRSLNIDTLFDTRVALVPDPRQEGYSLGPSPRTLTCGNGDDHAYLTYTLLEEIAPGSAREVGSRIQKFNLSTGASTLLAEFLPENGDPSLIGGARFDGDRLIAYPACCTPNPIFEVDTSSGTKTQVPTRFDVWMSNVAVDESNGGLFPINFDAVYRLDPGSDTYRILSTVPAGHPLELAQSEAAALDKRNNRVLIGDSSLDLIMQISLTTGRRTEFLARRRGEGVRIVTPREFYVTEDRTTAYLFDDGGNTASKLIEVDLATGNRRTIGDIDPGTFEFANGLAVDEEKGVAYVAFRTLVLEVELATGEVTQLASDSVGFGTQNLSVSGLALDKANNRLLLSNRNFDFLTDTTEESILALDLRSRVRTAISGAGVRGFGPAFSRVNSVALDAENNLLYTSNQLTGSVLAVDLETGDRSVVLDACPTNAGGNTLGNGQSLTHLSFDDDVLTILDRGIRKYNTSTEECTVVREFIQLSVLAISPLGNDIYLAAPFRGFGLYDAKANDFVFISE